MSHTSRYSRIPVPIKATVEKEKPRGKISERTKLPNIYNSYNSNVFKKNASQSRLDEFINVDFVNDSGTDGPRPGSMNNPPTSTMHDFSIKRYHSTGQVYPRNFDAKTNILKENQTTWPIMKEENFNEGYLKMQGIMNAKREDLLRKRGDIRRLGRQPLPPISRQHQDSFSRNSNSDEWESGSDSSYGFDTRGNTGYSETSETYLRNLRVSIFSILSYDY